MNISKFSRSYIFKNTSELLLLYIFCSLKLVKHVCVNILYSFQKCLRYDDCEVSTRPSFFESDLQCFWIGLPCFDSDLPCLESELPIFRVSPSHFLSQTFSFLRVSPFNHSKTVILIFWVRPSHFFRVSPSHFCMSVLLIFCVRPPSHFLHCVLPAFACSVFRFSCHVHCWKN